MDSIEQSDTDSTEEQPNNNENENLLPKSKKYEKYWYRWYICILFSLLGMFQGAFWNTWSPIDDSAEFALGFTTNDIELLVNWGPIAFLICMPIYMWLLDNKGLRVSVLSGSFFVALGTGLRCLPVPVNILRYFIHAGQVFNGIAGCPVMAIPPLLSNVWFPPNERITATGVATLFNYMGTGVAYIIGPLFIEDPPDNATFMPQCVHAHQPNCTLTYSIRKQIMEVMYLEFGIATAIFLCALYFFPSKPPTPPSVSASTQRMGLKEGLLQLRHAPHFWFVATVTALSFGTWGGWTGAMPLLLKPLGVGQDEDGFIGFLMTVVGCIVGMFVGWFTDRIKGRMKIVLFILLTVCFIMFVYFVIISNKWFNFEPFAPHKANIWVTMMILSIAMNGAVPVGMELAADSAYPVSEGTSTSIVVWLFNVLSFVFLLALNVSSSATFANYFMLGGLFISLPLLLFGAKSGNQRLQLDRSDDVINDGVTTPSGYGSMVGVNINTRGSNDLEDFYGSEVEA